MPALGQPQGLPLESPRSGRGPVAHGAAVGKRAPPIMSPEPRRGDIWPPQLRTMIAPSTTINHSALGLGALSRLPTFPMPPLPGLRLIRGPILIPRLRHGLQDAAAAAAEGTAAGCRAQVYRPRASAKADLRALPRLKEPQQDVGCRFTDFEPPLRRTCVRCRG